ncbi:hypothetical protein ACFP9V_23950 [Deinococcus radiopugnans]|uniref:Uncharacterized protein n=1 Tax=Deinococcus radiopugnans ATCC 19172 TaxID=585398 RepID=A0A5C4XI64_9DEIO|nr:hypothetical protein [Deinococcus radiopugnans]MBB6018840.1 hypothetical protein [Deinococcus radiopugnans ATCC 19172]TNM63203.1 hypothetical protein FHR04_20145 [Deinococcus radiopugnans ATCC 19172]
MKQSNRDRQWARIRWVEVAYSAMLLVVMIGLFGYASFRPASDLVFWLVSGVTLLAGLGLLARQYQVLDELGKLRFLKGLAVSGVITVSGLAWTLWWAAYQSVKLNGETQDLGSPALSFDAIYLSLLAGVIAMVVTQLYLRRRENSGG